MNFYKKARKYIISIVLIILIYLSPMFVMFVKEKEMINEMKSDLINYEMEYLTKMYKLRSEIYGEDNANLDEILKNEKEKFYNYCRESNYKCRFGIEYNFNYFFYGSLIWINYDFDDETKEIYKNLGKVAKKQWKILSSFS